MSTRARPLTSLLVLLLGVVLVSCSDASTAPDVGPAAVTLSPPTIVSPDTVSLTWMRSTDTDFASYDIYQSTTSGVGLSGTLVASVTAVADTTLTVGGLSEATPYYFAVFVFATNGLGTSSAEVSVETPSAGPFILTSDAGRDRVFAFASTDTAMLAAIPPLPATGSYLEPRNLTFSPDGLQIAAPFRHSDNLLLIERGSWSVRTVTDVTFDEPYATAYTVDGSELWVANKKGGGGVGIGSLTIVDPATATVIGSVDDVTFSSPESIVANSTHMFVINRASAMVTKVDIATRQVVDTLTVGYEPRYGVVSPDGMYLYVSNTSNDVSRIQTSDLTEVDSFSPLTFGTPRNMAINEDGSKVYVALQFSSAIMVIETATGSVTEITFTDASSPYGVALLEGTNRGYVTDESRGWIHVFDLTTETEIIGERYESGELSYPRAIAAR